MNALCITAHSLQPSRFAAYGSAAKAGRPAGAEVHRDALDTVEQGFVLRGALDHHAGTGVDGLAHDPRNAGGFVEDGALGLVAAQAHADIGDGDDLVTDVGDVQLQQLSRTDRPVADSGSAEGVGLDRAADAQSLATTTESECGGTDGNQCGCGSEDESHPFAPSRHGVSSQTLRANPQRDGSADREHLTPTGTRADSARRGAEAASPADATLPRAARGSVTPHELHASTLAALDRYARASDEAHAARMAALDKLESALAEFDVALAAYAAGGAA